MHDSLYQNWSSPILKPAARSMLCSAGLLDAGKMQTKTQASIQGHLKAHSVQRLTQGQPQAPPPARRVHPRLTAMPALPVRQCPKLP